MNNKEPKSHTLKFHLKPEVNLIVNGQCVFIFANNDVNSDISFQLLNDKMDGFDIKITQNQLLINRIGILEPLIDKGNSKGLINLLGAYYWFSIDSQNQQIYAGIGEARLETAIYKYSFIYSKENDELRKNNKLFLESINKIFMLGINIKPLKLLRDPITLNIPMCVRNTSDLTMDDIASGKFMPKSNLSIMSQKLYDCISGEKFVLDNDDFPDFTQAIEYSILNPNGWCYKKLQEKSTEFNKEKPNILETYLRITLGQNNGESPGIPYVMEIWPSGHFSPIHNHANAEAIIRVLYGEINVSLYPFLCEGLNSVSKFGYSDFKQDDITWISPTLNQTHKLENKQKDKTCITIQCYMYGEEDLSHYDYFDYIDANGVILKYEPDSDADFVEFKNLIREEWAKPTSSMFSCFGK
jgi:hypothetical protein